MTSIKKDISRGIFYTAIAKYSGIIVQLLVTAILARLLQPSDFGVVAIATVFITFFNILTDIGIGPAIIQQKDLTKDDLDHIYSLTVYMGLLCGGVFYILSWGIADYYSNIQLLYICQLLSIPIFVYSLNIVPNGLLLRDKKFRFMAMRTLLAQVFSGICAVIAAFYGWGIYALLVNPILSSIILFVMSYKCYPCRFHLIIQKNSILKIFSFSIYQFAFNFVNYFSRNLDKLLIGKFLGMNPLGYYEKSYRLMLLPLQNITFVITPAFQPVFSDLQNDKARIVYYYRKILYYLGWLAFPLTVLLFFLSEEAILLFFGNQWEAAVPVFRILSLSIFMQLLNSTAGAIYQSANATKQLFISGIWGAVFIVVGFTIPIFTIGTIEAVAYGYLIAQFANFVQTFYLLFKVLESSYKQLLQIWIPPFVFSIFLGCVLYWVSLFVLDLNLWITAIIKTSIWGIIVLSYLHYKKIIDIIQMVKSRNLKSLIK